MKNYYNLIVQQYKTEQRIKELEITQLAGEEYILDLKSNTEFILEHAKNKLSGPFTMENINKQIKKANTRNSKDEIETLEQFRIDLEKVNKMALEIEDRKKQLIIAKRELPLVRQKLETIRTSLNSIYQNLNVLKFDQDIFERLFAFHGVEVVLEFFIKSKQAVVTKNAVKLAAGNCQTATLQLIGKDFYKHITQWEIQNAQFSGTRYEFVEMLQTIGIKSSN